MQKEKPINDINNRRDKMEFQEPKVEFVEVSVEDIVTNSPGGGGTSADVCQGDTDNSCADSASYL